MIIILILILIIYIITRFDSEAILDVNDESRKLMKSQDAKAEEHHHLQVRDWAPPIHDSDLGDYAMSIVVDPSQRRKLLPNDIPHLIMSFLSTELVGDVFPSQWGSFDSWATITPNSCESANDSDMYLKLT
jgi:hypothetical protein